MLAFSSGESVAKHLTAYHSVCQNKHMYYPQVEEKFEKQFAIAKNNKSGASAK